MIKLAEDPEWLLKNIESHLEGGVWFGNVRYNTTPIYCELWVDVNPRVHIFFHNTCCLCGKHLDEVKYLIGHHCFYVKEACCWYDESGIYYTNLNAKNHPTKDYCIGENPNYFVILCPHCHGRTNGNFANRKYWADYFRNLIDTKYGGKCYLTKEEMINYEKTGITA
jgi:hypothetical protein